ncbi:MAG: alpha/beta hydrolase [Gammaproteobacteria bacterium]|nr:alpha/beta hydrolase [Gammaproteobacteria bacterium]
MNTQALSLTKLFFLFIASFSTSFSFAESVQLTTASDKEVIATYLQGEDNSNPVLILHGLLQTKDFSTVERLATSLNDSGYTVLNPTLSLGLSNRKQSLPCEAIHTHSLDSEADELGQWIEWLYEKTGKPVILIGHSSAGQVILKYMENSNAKFVNHSILISLSYYASGPMANENKNHAEKALNIIKENTNQLSTYALNYCETYPTYARNFLSYYNWNKSKTSGAISKLNKQVSIILGTDDKRIDDNWKQQLKNINSDIHLIEGANHFFDQTHEFDLVDTVEMLITDNTKQ